MAINLIVNGHESFLDIDPETPLIDVLRDRLQLTGTKQACGEGLCGSCTVLIDENPGKACKLKLKDVSGRNVTTIEGLGNAKHPNPIQAAFVESGAIQCGYCTPGMIMVAKALLDKNPDPSADEIDHAIRGNICRCTGYKKIEDAVRLAARYLKDNTEAKPHVIDPEILKKATGEAIYTDDMRIPGLLHAKVLHSEVSHGEILNLDVETARLQPGVRGVFTLNDVPGEKQIGRKIKDQPVFAHERIRYLGEPIALVVAESAEAAENALRSIKIDINPLQPVRTPQEALAAGAPSLHAKGNICWSQHVRRGNVDKAFGTAAAIVEDTYVTPFNEHLYMETDSGLASWDEKDRLVLYIATQEIHEIRKLVAASLCLPEEKVRVIQTATGGAFGGRKVCPFPVMVALAAYHLKAPVRLTYTRRETFLDSTKRHPFTMRYRLSADKDKNVTALEADITSDTGAYASYGPLVLGRALGHAASIYEIPNVSIQGQMIYTNNPIAGAMRGFGATQVHFAMECMMDRLARALSVEPAQFRRQNMLRPGSYTITGERMDGRIRVPQVVDTALTVLNEARKKSPAPKDNAPVKNSWKRGFGMACHWFGMGTTKPHDGSDVKATLQPDGIVEIGAGVADLGQGSTATLWTIAAETLGVSHEQIRVIHNDTTLTADSGPTNASRQTYFSGSALIDALKKLIENLTPLAARLLEMPPESVRFSDGVFFSPDYPEYRIPLKQLAATYRPEEIPPVIGHFEPNTTPMDPDTGAGRPYDNYITGAHVAEVDLNTQTGEIRIHRITSIHDIGKVVSRKRVEGQIEGCVAMAIGFTLMEAFKPGQTDSLKNYPVPRSRDIPEVCSILLEENGDATTFKAKGIGESGLLSVAPAIINAIADATGIYLTHLPATKKSIRNLVQSGTVRS